jgi:hypothetical protein
MIGNAHAESVALARQLHWYRGNTHAHTLNSDGDAAPDAVVRWYREHDYQFVVITDHEFLTDVEPLNKILGADERFLVIRGQEVTQWSENPRQPAAHVNAIDNTRVVFPVGERQCNGGGCGARAPSNMPLSETYAKNIAAIVAAGGLAQVNHPNYMWSVRPEDLFAIPDRTLFEIWNGIPNINNLGGSDGAGNTSQSTEELWDQLLSRGQILWGVGSDDSHEYHDLDNAQSARPGQAWIVVRAAALKADAIVAALRAGDFYASNGVVLEDVKVDARSISITVKPDSSEPARASRYLTRFIGRYGKVLAEVAGLKPSYLWQGGEGYVRATIIDSNGRRAWVQPVFSHRE